MKYEFIDEYVTRSIRTYDLEIDDDCEIKIKDGIVFIDDIELYYILDEFERDEFERDKFGPILVKINGVRIIKKEENEETNFVSEKIVKIEEKK